MAYAFGVLGWNVVKRIERPQPTTTVYTIATGCTREHLLDLIAMLRRQNPDAIVSLAGDHVIVRD